MCDTPLKQARKSFAILSLQISREMKSIAARPLFRWPHSTYQKVVQGKCPLLFANFNGAVCSNTLFSNDFCLNTNPLLFRGNSTCKGSRTLIWSNASGFQFWGPLARTKFQSARCGLPMYGKVLSNSKRFLDRLEGLSATPKGVSKRMGFSKWQVR